MNFSQNKTLKLVLSGIVLIAVIAAVLIYANTKKNEKKIIDEQNSIAVNEPQKVAPQNPDIQNNYSSRSHYSKSPDREISAEVVRENGNSFDSILIKSKDNTEGLIALKDFSYTGIESTAWLDNSRYALCGHVNPSLEVYILIDTQKKQITGNYYGIGFTWSKNKDRLYYIETSPHFSEQISDKIVDNEGHTYFETQKGESIIDKPAISDDEQTFAFYIGNSTDESRKLTVAKMDQNKKLQKQTTIGAQFGDIEFNNNKSIKITAPDGKVYNYDWIAYKR